MHRKRVRLPIFALLLGVSAPGAACNHGAAQGDGVKRPATDGTVSLANVTGASEIIPADRRTTWNPGLNAVGGIPYRTTIYTTISPSGGDDTATIQTALDNCPSNQVVKLGAGTFHISSSALWPRSNTTLRGSGPGNTILLSTGAASLVFVGRLWYTWSDQANLTADAAKGTNSTTIATNPGLQVGEIVNVDETYDPLRTRFAPGNAQNGDYQGWGEGRKGPQADSRPIGQAMEIASITGSGPYTVTFTTPFHMAYRTAHTAHVARLSGGIGGQREWVGVEDLTVSDGDGGDDGGPISFSVAKYSWARNIESTRSSAASVLFKSTVRCVLRDSYIHSTVDPNPGGAGYGIAIDSYSADNLVENNVVWNFNKVMLMRSSGGGNVIGYNYMEDGWGAGYPNIVETGLNASHMTTPHYELFEGNQCFNFSSDGTWGNSIYITALRNHLTALRRSIPPLILTDTYGRRAIEVVYSHRWYSFIGNVLGTQGQTLLPGQTDFLYEYTGSDRGDLVFMWKLGTPWPGDPQDPTVVATTLRHGNFDYVSNNVVWDPTITDHNLPASLYLTAKPAFFGNNTWPWVEPTGVTKTHTLPARARFDTDHRSSATATLGRWNGAALLHSAGEATRRAWRRLRHALDRRPSIATGYGDVAKPTSVDATPVAQVTCSSCS